MNITYRWKITKDYTAQGMPAEYDDTGVEGPRGLNRDLVANPAQFYMYDDDGNIYYKGVIYGVYTGFEPLDDFGAPLAGCTSIHVKKLCYNPS